MKMSTKKRKILKVALLAVLSTGVGISSFVAPIYTSSVMAWSHYKKNTDKGANSKSDGYGSTAFGNTAWAIGGYSAAFGYMAKTWDSGKHETETKPVNYGSAFGSMSQAYGDHSTALGAYARIEKGATDAVALGYGSYVKESDGNVVSVGTDDSQRRIIHVADGENDTDAVTLAQLKKFAFATDENGVVSGQYFTMKSNSNVANIVNAKGETLVKITIDNGVVSSDDPTNKGYVSGETMYNELRAPISVNYVYSGSTGSFKKYKDWSTPYISNTWTTGYNLKTLAYEVRDLDDHFEWSDGKATNDLTSQWIWGGFQDDKHTVSGTQVASYGINNIASGTYLTAVGSLNTVYGTSATAIGRSNASGAQAAGKAEATKNTTAVGVENQAKGNNSSAYGYASQASGQNSTAIGAQSYALQQNATAVGASSKANGQNATAVGSANTADVSQSSAFGYNNTAGGTASTAMGANSKATEQHATAVGSSTKATASYASVYGYNSTASGASSIAIGNTAVASNTSAVAVGQNATADGLEAIAIGFGSSAAGEGSIALGSGSSTLDTEKYVVSVGGTKADKSGILTRRIIHVADGADMQDAATVHQLPTNNQELNFDSVNTAQSIVTNAGDTIATLTIKKGEIAKNNKGFVDGGTVYQYINDNALAIVDFNHDYAKKNDHWLSTDYGLTVEKKGVDSTAYGYKANAQADQSVAIGYNAVVESAGEDSTSTGAIALGAGSVVGSADGNVLSIGGAVVENPDTGEFSKVTRRIINVAAGENATDAANVGQLLAKTTVTLKGGNNTAVLKDQNGNDVVTLTVQGLAGEDGKIAQIVEWSDGAHWLSTDFDKEFDTKGENSTAYGYGANAQAADSVAIGAGSIATVENTFSVGSTDNARRIVNVAAGKEMTDAANVSQLVKANQFINADNNQIIANDGTVLATISGFGGSDGGSGGGIVDYNFSYADTDKIGDYSHHYLSTDFGKKASTLHGNNSAAYGYKANARAEDSVAIGTNALATGRQTVALGAGSVATGLDENGEQLKDADGNFLREVSFGHKAGDTAADGTVYDTDLKSKLTNIAYGEGNNDVATIGQILADGQTLSLASTAEPEGGEDTRTNVLRANDGTVLATLEKGTVSSTSTGFVSGADVYAADVKVQQIDGVNNVIKNNAGKGLVTISVAEDGNSDGSSFVTKNYFENNINQIISEASIVSFDSDYKSKEGTDSEGSYLATDFGKSVEHGANSAAYGYRARAYGNRSVVIGAYSSANDEDAVVIGAGATANGEGSVAIGAGSKVNNAYEVSFGVGFGDGQFTRKLTNVTEGTELTDAVTLSQITQSGSKVSLSNTDNEDKTQNSNVLLANDGTTVLATFQKGEIQKNDGGFASGGDVWLADVKSGQILSGYVPSGTSDASVATEGSTSIVNNKGDTLFSIKVASSDAIDKEGNGFLTEKYYYDTIDALVQDSGIIDYDVDYATSDKHWLATGFGASVSHSDDSTAYGYNATATGVGAVAIGANSVAYGTNTFSVGNSSTGLLRKIVNVDEGSDPSDAATVSQLIATQNLTISPETPYATIKDEADRDVVTITVQGLGGTGGTSSSIVQWHAGNQWLTTSYDASSDEAEPGEQSTAYGYGAKATAPDSVAIGYGSIATEAGVFSVGGSEIYEQEKDENGNLAFTYDDGSDEKTVYRDKDNTSIYYDEDGAIVTVDLTKGSLTEILEETGTTTRRIVNVTDGEENTDAATFGQIVKKGQAINATNNQVLGNNDEVLFTIEGLSSDGGTIVKYDPNYGTSSNHWLSTDFDKSIKKGTDSAAYGYGATAEGKESVAIGKDAYADGAGSIAIGSGSVAHTGKDGIAEISFGHAATDINPDTGDTYTGSLTRRLANVEAGVKSGDVATWDQVVEVGQTLYASTADREVEDDEGTTTTTKKAQNVLYNNKGDALATLSIGNVTEDSTGFVSGGDVYDAIAAEGQLVTLSTALRTEDDETKGQGNQIVTNTGTVLATFKAADTTKDDTYNADAFVTAAYLKDKIYKDSIVDYDKDYGTTTGSEEGSDLVVHDDYWLSTDFGKAATTKHGKNSTAYGYQASAQGEKAVAVGAGATATGASSVAVGNNATTSYDNAIALGSGAKANKAGAIAIGQGSIANFANEVSFGDSETESTWRKLTNVADGTKKGDVATWSQATSAGQNVTLSTSIRANTSGKTTKENEIAANDGTVLATFTRVDTTDGLTSSDYGFVAGRDLYDETRGAIVSRAAEAAESPKDESLQLHYVASTNTAAQNLIALDQQVYTNYSDIQKLRDLSNLTTDGDKYIIEKAKAAVKIEQGSNISVRKIEDNNTGTVTYRISADAGSASGDRILRQSNLMQANVLAVNSINSISLTADGVAADSTVDYKENYNDSYTDGGNSRVDLSEYKEVVAKLDPSNKTLNMSDSPLYDSTNYGNWLLKTAGRNSLAVGSFVLATGDKSVALGDSAIASGLFSTAIGDDSVATEDGEVSFGHDIGDIDRRSTLLAATLGEDGSIVMADNPVTYEKELNRRLTHVAAGTNNTDAANVGQLVDGTESYSVEDGTVTVKNKAGDIAFTISGLASVADAESIVDYDSDYANTTEVGHSRWLSTDFDKTNVTHGTDSTAYGYGANANGDESVAIGKNAYADGEGSIAIGAGSVAHTTTDDEGNQIQEISFGHAATDINPETGKEYDSVLKRKLTNVEYGTENNDVATVGQTVAGGQAVTLSADPRDEKNTQKGNGNQIVANDGTVLATFTGMTSVTETDTGFVSGGDLYDETRKGIADTVYHIDKGATAGANLSALDAKIGEEQGGNYYADADSIEAKLKALDTKIGEAAGVEGVYAATDSIETQISKVAKASIASDQEVSFAEGKNVITDANDEPNTLVTFKKGSVATGDDGFVSGGQVYAADVAGGTVDLSATGNKVYTNGDSANALLTFSGMQNVASDDYGFVSGADLYTENRADILTRKATYISQTDTVGANLSALDAKAIYYQEQEVDEDGNVAIYSNDGKALFTISGIQRGADSDFAGGGMSKKTKVLQSASLQSFDNRILLANLNDALQASGDVLTVDESAKYADFIDNVFTFGKKGSSDDVFQDGVFSNTKNKSVSSVRNDAQGTNSVADGGYLNVASGVGSATYGYATYAAGDKSAAFGSESVAESNNEVSFGHSAGDIDLDSTWSTETLTTFDSDLTRRLTHVSAGYNDTDVVNFSQIKTVAPTYTEANHGTTYLTSSLDNDGSLNTTAGTVGQNLAALDAKAVKSGQSLSFSTTSTSGTLYSNDGTALATISVTGLGESSGKGSSIVDYDPEYAKASTESEKHSGWLSTDFNQTSVTHGADSAAYGYGANAQGDESVAIGKDATAVDEGSVAIGAGAKATAGSVAIGEDSVAYQADEVSFGHQSDDIIPGTTDQKYGNTVTRKLTNVKDGTSVSDAATYGQIATAGQSVKLSTDARNADNEKAGKYNELVANSGTVLATFERAQVKSGDTGFVSGGDLYTEVRTKDGTHVKSAQTTKENLEALDAAIVSNSNVIHQDTNNIIKIGEELDGTGIDVSGKGGKRKITGVADGTTSGDAATWDQIAQANQVLYATSSTEDRGNNQAGNVLYDNAGNALATLSIGTVSEGNTGFVSGGQVWANDIKSRDYNVTYNGEVGEVVLERNNGETIKIGNIRTTLDPDAGETIATYEGDNATVFIDKKDGVGTISAVTSNLTDENKTGLAKVEDVYNYLAPEDGSDLVSKDKTTGENLATLGSAVKTNADAITNLQNMTNVSPEGQTVIKNYAKEAVKVAGSDNITVTPEDKDGTMTYTVSAKTGSVAQGDTGLVTGDDVQTAIDKALEEIIGGDGSTGTLSSKANIDASNVGRNVAGADSQSDATEEEKQNSMTAWGEALGGGTVDADSKQLITGATLYNEVRPTDGTYVAADKSVADNLAALDTAVANSSSVINKEGDTIYIGKDTTDTVINVAGKDGKDGADGKTIERVITGVAEGDSDGDVATWNQIAASGQTLYASTSTGLRSGESRENSAGNILYDNMGNALATLSVGSVTQGSNGFVSGGQVWENDIASGTYTVEYDTLTDKGTVKLRRNGEAEGAGSIVITGIKTQVNPDVTGIDSYNGSDYINVEDDTISANTGELRANTKTGLATVADVYDYLTPANANDEKVDGTYAQAGKTTGQNLYALDTQVKTNADAITKLQDMEDISPKGTTVIQNISKEAAKDAVQVKAGTSGYVTVTPGSDANDNLIYTVDVLKGTIANGSTGFVDAQDV